MAAGTAIQQQPSAANSERVAPARSLTLVAPSDIMALWPRIGASLLYVLPPHASGGAWSEERVLLAITRSQLSVWIYAEGQRVLGVLSTTEVGDSITGARSLLIYTASGIDALTMTDWWAMFETLSAYCKREGIAQIIAFSDVQRVLDIVNQLGGSTAQSLCVLSVESAS